MNLSRSFFIQLAVLSVAVVALIFAAGSAIPQIAEHWKFSLGTVLVFAAICVGMFFAGKKSAVSEQRLAFNNLVLSSVFGKMVLAIALLFTYRTVAQPTNNLFVLIFLLIYVAFTVFEVIFMSKLARLKKPE